MCGKRVGAKKGRTAQSQYLNFLLHIEMWKWQTFPMKTREHNIFIRCALHVNVYPGSKPGKNRNSYRNR